MVRDTKPIPSRPTTPAANPNNVTIVTFLPGEEFYRDDKQDSDPGNTITTISYTVPVAKILYISQIRVSHRQPMCWELKADSDIIGSGNTGSANLESHFSCNPVRPIAAGVVVKLEITALSSAKVSSVLSHLQGGLKDA